MKLSANKANFVLAALITSSILITSNSNAQQAVTGIITDYNSYWKSGVGAINPVKPVNSHNLLAFTYNGTQYSTGVNDQALLSHGQTFTAGDFWSLPVSGLSGALTSNTKVGLGEMYDGVHNGASNPAPARDINLYLSDGIKGLNIGTCIANLPVGTLSFFITNVRPQNIGDGIPDILITQVADPSNTYDRYSLVDANGNIVGQSKDVTFNNISAVGNWTVDFYEASKSPMTLTSGFTNTDRPLRLWAADLSDFGITQANYASISYFRINLSGNSDVAFVAYNNRTFNINSGVLPVSLINFSGKAADGKAKLSWSTATEINTKHFVIERSQDNSNFTAIDTVAAAGNSSILRNYSAVDANPKNGINFYRLKIVDFDGHTEYSKVIKLDFTNTGGLSVTLFPNPATGKVQVTYSSPATAIRLFNSTGMLVRQVITSVAARQATIELINLPKGVYYITVDGENGRLSSPLVVK